MRACAHERQDTLDRFVIRPHGSGLKAGHTHVVSLYDTACTGLQPWRARGFSCYAYVHSDQPNVAAHVSNGVTVRTVNLALASTMTEIRERHAGHVAFAYAAPPSRDLSYAGMRWWARKSQINPFFQSAALQTVHDTRQLLQDWGCPFFLSMPGSCLVTRMWRSADHLFHPYEFGGYLGDEDHPSFPGITPRRDAYAQRHALWVGGGLRMPDRKPVVPVWVRKRRRGVWAGSPRAWRRASPMCEWKARYARKALPRGFATALCARLVGSSH